MDKFFKNKNILITGIDGFIGKHLEEKLLSLGSHVFGITTQKPRNNVFNVNITDKSAVNDVIKNNNITHCFHLAAVSLVEEGQEDPYLTYSVNLIGTLNVLESARVNKLERIIVASTSHVYGDNTVPYKESYFPRPSRPYETSKACTDLIAQSYADTFNLPVLIPRFVNIYGPGDINYSRLIPKTIKAVLDNNPPTMWGGNAIRDYLYIDDAINGYLKLGSIPMIKIEKNRIFNFGGGNRITVKDLIQKIISLSGKDVTIVKTSDQRENEIKSQYVSFAKAKRILKWNPAVSMEDGLKKTIKWYINNS